MEHIVNIGFDIDGSRKAIELAEKYNGLYATVGIHPHNANQLNQNVLDELRKLSENPKVVAIGEIGLDYYRNLSPRETQKKAFKAQLFLAEELELPVVIHDREAHVDILDLLSKFKGRIKGIMHCFSGNTERFFSRHRPLCRHCFAILVLADPYRLSDHHPPGSSSKSHSAQSHDPNCCVLSKHCPTKPVAGLGSAPVSYGRRTFFYHFRRFRICPPIR